MIEPLALGERPIEQLRRAVDRGSLLVAGDQEADRPRQRPPADEAERRGEACGKAALHVAGAASPELTVGDFRGERIEPPARKVAGRHDVGVAGEDEVGRSCPDAGVKIENVRRSRRRERDEFGLKSSLAQEIAQRRQRAMIVRRDRRKSNQRARDLERRRNLRSSPQPYRGRISRTGAAQSSPTS